MAYLPVTGDPGQDVVSGGRPPLDDAGRRRRRRQIAASLTLALVAAVIVGLVRADPGHRPTAPSGLGPSAPTRATGLPSLAPAPPPHANGALFGHGAGSLAHPSGLKVPALGFASSPTWSPDGSQVAVIDGGILVTDVATGAYHRFVCPRCQEVAWSPDGRELAVSPLGSGPLGLVDATTGALSAVAVPGVGAVLSLTWSPGSDELAFLANAGEGRSGVYLVRADGTGLTEVEGARTRRPSFTAGAARAIEVRWSPTGQTLAVLTATPDPPSGPPPISRYRLRVVTMNPDGSAPTTLVDDGRCACTGFTPSLAWSPDGTTLAVLARHRHQTLLRPDGNGGRLRIRFVRGSGALSWQPR